MQVSDYSVSDRPRMVGLSYQLGVRLTAERFSVHPSTVKYWRQQSRLSNVFTPGRPDMTRRVVVGHEGR